MLELVLWFTIKTQKVSPNCRIYTQALVSKWGVLGLT